MAEIRLAIFEGRYLGFKRETLTALAKHYKFDLDENARVQGTIVVGQPATVTYVESGGKKLVKVIAAGETTP